MYKQSGEFRVSSKGGLFFATVMLAHGEMIVCSGSAARVAFFRLGYVGVWSDDPQTPSFTFFELNFSEISALSCL